MSDEFNVKPKEGQTLEDAIAENLQMYSVGVTYIGGLSVKYKGGGASANASKIKQTEYSNKDTKNVLLDIQSIYGVAYPKDKSQQANIPSKNINEASSKLKKTFDWAIKAGIIDANIAKRLQIVGAEKANAVLKNTLKSVAKCKGSNRKNFEKAVTLHHIMMQTTAYLNNRDLKYTRFSNFNEEISQNKEGVATAVRDNIADGVSKPCYMNPSHNPGFSLSKDSNSKCITGTPTNQNPSHITTELPKLLQSK
jgi:hypothetical protein